MMKKKYFEVNLCNDDINSYRVICTYNSLLGIREIVTNRMICIKCSHELCYMNNGLSCEDDFNYIKEEEVLEYLTKFKDSKEKEAYKNYLNEVEKISMEKYNNVYNLYKNTKKRRIKRK